MLYTTKILFGLGCIGIFTACGARTQLEVGGGSSSGGQGGEGGEGGSPKLATCGNGVVDPGEECDDGNQVESDACLSNCKKARCGDGIKSTHEACDDGNQIDDDTCRNDCSLPTCGDGVVQGGEQCDSPDPTECTPLCLLPACGDGFLDPATEACDAGPSNEDRPAITLIHDGQSQAVIPIRGSQSDFAFYDYQSESAHTGFEKLHTSNLFLRQESGMSGLSLFSVSGIDLDSSGQDEGDGAVNQTFSGLPAGATVTLADDNPNEIQGGAPTVNATWQFHHNTDGGVIGGIAFPGSWVIEIDSSFIQSITAWRYDDALVGPIALISTTAILKALPTPSQCRPDCTVPRCGDAILDGGEVCDDGNQVSGDGCSADCSTTD